MLYKVGDFSRLVKMTTACNNITWHTSLPENCWALSNAKMAHQAARLNGIQQTDKILRQ